ncbi:hypothetical protein AAC387_Pa02g4579 [Persea americana]
MATAPNAGDLLCPNLEIDSWLGFQYPRLDFGGGGPCAFLNPELPVEGLLVFVPSCKVSDGVDAYIVLQQHDMWTVSISHKH